MNRGQIQLIPLAITGLVTILGSIGTAWITGASAANREMFETKLEQQKTDASQEQNLASLKISVCIQNQNIKAIGQALKVNVTDDPNCR